MKTDERHARVNLHHRLEVIDYSRHESEDLPMAFVHERVLEERIGEGDPRVDVDGSVLVSHLLLQIVEV